MLRVCVLVSGGGPNPQATLEAMGHEAVTNAEVVNLISNIPVA